MGKRDLISRQVLISAALFEARVGNKSRARAAFEKGNKALQESGEKEERVLLLEAWMEFEEGAGDPEEKVRGRPSVRIFNFKIFSFLRFWWTKFLTLCKK